jgi:ubiquinone/menaquinone biosynthesis C-methylase UbiE
MAILLEIRQEMQSGRLFDKNWDGNTLEDAGSRLARDTSKLRVVEQAYDAVAPEYGQGVDPKTSELLDDFVSMLPADAPVLDAGTGTGRNLSWMAGRLAELGDARPLLGADLSGGMLSQAHERTGLKNLMKMDLVRIAFPGNFFAGVVCYTVIHLMSDEDLATALDEFWRVLVDGGVLFIYAKVADSRRLQQDDQVPGFVSPESSAGQLYAQRPVNRHDQDWLRSIFVSKGFRVLKEGSSQDGMGTGRAYFYLTPSNKADLMLLSAEYERLKSLGRPLPLREAHNIITLLGPEEEQVTLNFGTELAGKVALVAPKRAGSEYYIHTLADAEFNNAILIGYRKGDDRITLFEPSSSTVESVAIPKNRWFSPEMLKETRIVRTFENKVFSRYYDNPANRMALIKERLRLTAPAGGHAGAWEATRGASRVTYRSFRLLLPSMSKKKWVDRNFHYLRTGSSRGEEKIPTAILLGKSLADADALAASEA